MFCLPRRRCVVDGALFYAPYYRRFDYFRDASASLMPLFAADSHAAITRFAAAAVACRRQMPPALHAADLRRRHVVTDFVTPPSPPDDDVRR